MRWLTHESEPRPRSKRVATRAWLIVNADDLGASPGVNSGILEAHRCGLVTSASLLVGTPWSREAAMAVRSAPALSVGLHADIDDLAGSDVHVRGKLIRDALTGQLAKFERLIGRPPTHLDSHHDAHEESIANTEFLRFARTHRLSLRGCPPIRSVRSFHGRSNGLPDTERIGPESLLDILGSELGDGVTELVCHPGHLDAVLDSSYRIERVFELKTLCNPMVRAELAERSIKLIRHEDVARLFARQAGA